MNIFSSLLLPSSRSDRDFTYYIQQPGVKRDYSRRTHEELINDVNALHRFTRQLVKERDRFQHQVEWQKIWNRILAAAVVVEFTMLGWIASWLVSNLVKR